MLNVTKAAGEYLNDMLMRSQAPAEAAVRIVPKPEGDGLMTTLDHERAGDQHFDCDGHTVLVLDPEVATKLSEQTLDVGDSGARLVIS
jgi:hypothetical protein